MRDMKEYKGGGEMKNLLRIMLAFWNTKIIPSTGRVLATADTRKNFLLKLYSRLNACGRKLLFTMYTVKFRYIVLVYLINFLAGRVLALQGDFPGSAVHQINLTIICFIVFYIFQYEHKVTDSLYHTLAYASPDISVCLDRLGNAKLALPNLLLPMPPVIFSTKISMDMAFVPKSPVGYYLYFFYAATLYISLVGYCLMLLATKAVYEMTKVECRKLPFSYPNDLLEIPDWLKSLANLYHKAQISFFTIGMIFTVEFIFLIPDNIKVIDIDGGLNTALPLSFWYAWAIIFTFIIIAFPIFWAVWKRLLTQLTLNFNQRAVTKLMALNNRKDLTSVWSYYQLINHAARFEKKIFPKHNVYPLITTTISFILNLSKMLDLLQIPFGISL